MSGPSVTPPPTAGPAATHWAEALAAWRIPDEILAAAPRSPWIHPVELFRADDAAPDSPSRSRARERLTDGDVVLDVGCGGGRAAFAVAPPNGEVIGVDQQPGMLEEFAAGAERRGLRHREILGAWPDVAAATPAADVVVCHHVAYNVPDLGSFALGLDARARRRVVLELPDRHPLAATAPLWRHFWGLDRPAGPTASDAVAVLAEVGLTPVVEFWDEAPGARDRPEIPPARRVEFMRVRLCLPADRDAEVAELMARHPAPPRRVATVWWDRPEPLMPLA